MHKRHKSLKKAEQIDRRLRLDWMRRNRIIVIPYWDPFSGRMFFADEQKIMAIKNAMEALNKELAGLSLC